MSFKNCNVLLEGSSRVPGHNTRKKEFVFVTGTTSRVVSADLSDLQGEYRERRQQMYGGAVPYKDLNQRVAIF